MPFLLCVDDTLAEVILEVVLEVRGFDGVDDLDLLEGVEVALDDEAVRDERRDVLVGDQPAER